MRAAPETFHPPLPTPSPLSPPPFSPSLPPPLSPSPLSPSRNAGRVGTIGHIEKHPGSFDIVQVKDASGNVFATRMQNIFVVGEKKSQVSLPKGKGIKLSIHEERAKLQQKKKQ